VCALTSKCGQTGIDNQSIAVWTVFRAYITCQERSDSVALAAAIVWRRMGRQDGRVGLLRQAAEERPGSTEQGGG